MDQNHQERETTSDRSLRGEKNAVGQWMPEIDSIILGTRREIVLALSISKREDLLLRGSEADLSLIAEREADRFRMVK